MQCQIFCGNKLWPLSFYSVLNAQSVPNDDDNGNHDDDDAFSLSSLILPVFLSFAFVRLNEENVYFNILELIAFCI